MDTMTYSLLIILGVTLFFTFIVVLWLLFISALESQQLRQRFKRLSEEYKVQHPKSNVKKDRLFQALLKSSVTILHKIHLLTNPKSKPLSILLVNAGMRSKNVLLFVTLAQLLLPFFLVVYVIFQSHQLGIAPGSLIHIVLLIIIVLAGTKLPYMMIERKALEYQMAIRHALPDTMQLMVMCMDAGYSNNKILDIISKEFVHFYPEIADEIEVTLAELKLMQERATAWQNLAHRIDIPELEQLTALLEQNDKYGVTITHLLQDLMKRMRQERLLAAEEKGGKLPAKLTLPMALFFLPIMLTLVISPAIANVIRTLTS